MTQFYKICSYIESGDRSVYRAVGFSGLVDEHGVVLVSKQPHAGIFRSEVLLASSLPTSPEQAIALARAERLLALEEARENVKTKEKDLLRFDQQLSAQMPPKVAKCIHPPESAQCENCAIVHKRV